MRKFSFFLSLFLFLSLSSCTKNKAELGTVENPIKLFFVPSIDAKVLEDNSKIIKGLLEKFTPYHYEVAIPQSFVAVVEAFGTNRADVAAINTFGYVLAYDKYGAQARLTVLRHGSSTYQSQFVALEKSSINKIEDLAGKKIAFVDPASTSGYLLPLKNLKDKKIQPSETVFAMKHDNVISMIYQGQVDAGATYYSPPQDGVIQDARRLVITQYPDIEKKVKIVSLSDSIPNDPIVFRKDLPEEMKTQIVDAFIQVIQSEEGKKAFNVIYGADGLMKANDKDYQSVREMLKALGKSASELVKK